jgi:NADPH2:quinone reductase
VRAVQVRTLDGPSAVVVTEVDVPSPRDGEVAVEVHAAGVNFPDVLISKGLYQHSPELPFTVGCDVAGVVREVGADVARWKVGQRVAGYCGTGGLADVAVLRSEALYELPDGVPCPVGSALATNSFTAHFALRRRGALLAGEKVLVHGAGGGLGSATVQVASAFGGSVLAVASTPEKRATALRAGAEMAVSNEQFPAAARDFTSGRGIGIVADPVGSHLTDSLRALAPEGRLLVLGFAAGSIPEVRVNRLLLHNISVVGVGWGAFVQIHADYVSRQWAELVPLVLAQKIWPHLGETYNLEDVREALKAIEERRSVGQTILAVKPCRCGIVVDP